MSKKLYGQMQYTTSHIDAIECPKCGYVDDKALNQNFVIRAVVRQMEFTWFCLKCDIEFSVVGSTKVVDDDSKRSGFYTVTTLKSRIGTLDVVTLYDIAYQRGMDKQKSCSVDIDMLLEMLREVLSNNISDVCIDPLSCCIHDSECAEDFDWILEGFKLRFESYEKSKGVL